MKEKGAARSRRRSRQPAAPAVKEEAKLEAPTRKSKRKRIDKATVADLKKEDEDFEQPEGPAAIGGEHFGDLSYLEPE